MSTSGYRAFTPPRIRLRAIPCTEPCQDFHFLTIRPSAPGHSPPTVAPGCVTAGGCSGEPLPPASRSSRCAPPAGGFALAPSAMGCCSGATGASAPGIIPPGSPPVAPAPYGLPGVTRPPPRSPRPQAPCRAGAGRAPAPAGYLPIGKSVAAATLSMAKNAAVTITMIFMMLTPRGLVTHTVDPNDGPIRPFSQQSSAALLSQSTMRRATIFLTKG
jgi:hypothetical protein